MIFWQIIFWFSLYLLLHTYVFYPWFLQLLSANKKEQINPVPDEDLPALTVLMSVYNEEEIIEEKIASLLGSNYPKDKLNILIGSDASTDRTNDLLKRKAAGEKALKVLIYEERKGKPFVINKLVEESSTGLLVLTDAKVLFHKDTLRNLAGHFKDSDIGAVGGNILNNKVGKDGVSIQEKAFMSREILMKYREGLIWGATVGVYGAVYAIRKELFSPVPAGFSVDDFFISMNVLRQKKKVILDMNALTYEDVPNKISEEYRRKVRIAAGNFSNLRYFWKELFPPWKGASFAYVSHKVLRWLGPFLLAFILLSNILLYNTHQLYNYSLFIQLGAYLLPILDYFLSKIGIHIVFLRFVRHFITMNIALFHGLINKIQGINRDVWQPTKR
ncbi:glycosyltransferase [Bacteroidota bacterium]